MNCLSLLFNDDILTADIYIASVGVMGLLCRPNWNRCWSKRSWPVSAYSLSIRLVGTRKNRWSQCLLYFWPRC